MASYGLPVSMYSRKKNQIQAKCERSLDYQNMLFSDILHNQQTDSNGDLTDTLLICNGGSIRVHAFILMATSPFIEKVIGSQGENYPFVREILLPDFSVKEIEKMLNLIYKGYVDLQNVKELQSLQETLRFFQIFKVEIDNKLKKGITGSIKVHSLLNRIPQDIFKNDVKERNKLSEGCEFPLIEIDCPSPKKAQNCEATTALATDTDAHEQLQRGRIVSKPVVKLGKAGKKKNATEGKSSEESDYKADSVEESNNEVPNDKDTSPRKRAKLPLSKQPVAKLPQIMNTIQPSSPISRRTALPIAAIAESATPASTATGLAIANDNGNSGTDTEDEDWVEPNFKDKKWFAHESRRCQTCKKTFSNPTDATACITSHQRLRCYFCFRTFTDTKILFRHYRRRHKHAEKESTLICPFCDLALPYLSVSLHVISVHLMSSLNFGVRKGPGRPPTIPAAPSTSGQSLQYGSLSTGKNTNCEHNRNAPEKVNGSTSPKKIIKKKKKKKKGTQLKLTDMKKMLRKDYTNGELRLRDLDVTLEKVSRFGRTITFRLQKKRLDDENDDTGS